MSQFMVIRSANTKRGLAIAGPTGTDAALTVTNNLGTDVEQLVVTDAGGQCYWAERVRDGTQSRAEPIVCDRADTALAALGSAHRPAFPVGYDPQYYRRAFGWSYYWSNVDDSMPKPRFATGILERSLSQALSGRPTRRSPRSYVAITRSSPEVPLGYSQLREEASFHVIVGRW
jgi:hypothetical protein